MLVRPVDHNVSQGIVEKSHMRERWRGVEENQRGLEMEISWYRKWGMKNALPWVPTGLRLPPPRVAVVHITGIIIIIAIVRMLNGRRRIKHNSILLLRFRWPCQMGPTWTCQVGRTSALPLPLSLLPPRMVERQRWW